MFKIQDVIKLLTKIFVKRRKRFPIGMESIDIRIKAKKIYDVGKAENYKGAISEDQLKQFLAFEEQQLQRVPTRVIPGDSPEGKIITDKITGKNVIKFPGGGVDKVPVTQQFTGQSFTADDHIKFIKSKEPIESMKEANALIGRKNPSYKGRYKNITDDEAKQILKDTEDHIFQRDVVPDEFDPDYASGGLAHMLGEPTYSNGGEVKKKPFLEKIFGPTLESQWDTYTDEQKQYIRENHPGSVPEGQAQGGRIGAEGGGIAGMLGEPTYREPMLWGGTPRIKKAIEYIRNALRSRGIEKSRTSKTFQVIPERDKRLGKILGIEAPQKSSSALAESIVEKLKMDLKHSKRREKITEGITSTLDKQPGLKIPEDYTDYFKKSLTQMFDESKTIEDIEKNLGIMEIIQRNLSGRKLNAEGGRIGFEKGGFDPSKRTFLKIAAGLATLPVIGKYFKWAKPAVKALSKAPTITKGAGGMPNYIYDLITVVKAKGKKSIEPGMKRSDFGTKHTYKEVDVTEDVGGNIRIKKEVEGGGQYTDEFGDPDTWDGVVRELDIEITKGGHVKNKQGKMVKEADQYFEGTVTPDMDGKMKEVIEEIDEIDHLDLKEIADEAKDLMIKKASGGRVPLGGGGLAGMLGE